MALTAQLRGQLIHVARVPYDFTPAGGTRMQGVTRLLTVAVSDQERAHDVKFRADQGDAFDAFVSTLKFGDRIAFEVIPGPKDNPRQHDFVGVVEAEMGGTLPKAVATA